MMQKIFASWRTRAWPQGSSLWFGVHFSILQNHNPDSKEGPASWGCLNGALGGVCCQVLLESSWELPRNPFRNLSLKVNMWESQGSFSAKQSKTRQNQAPLEMLESSTFKMFIIVQVSTFHFLCVNILYYMNSKPITWCGRHTDSKNINIVKQINIPITSHSYPVCAAKAAKVYYVA